MAADAGSRIAIVDYGLGNLYSVKHACAHVGLQAEITSSAPAILAADAVILPGVGAFGDAMRTLHALDLVGVIRDVAASGRPLLGICLGMQLLMTESEEFGSHRGLGIVPGRVVKLDGGGEGGRRLKVPHIGWARVRKAEGGGGDPWAGTVLDGVADGERMYFVHSFVVQPSEGTAVLATSDHGDGRFCSSLRLGAVMACQFHPERSGPPGLHMYRNLAALVTAGSKERFSGSVA